MEILTTIFYALVSICFAFEITKLSNIDEIYIARKELDRKGKLKSLEGVEYSRQEKFFLNFNMLEIVVCIVGLFSSQWILFLFIIINSIIVSKFTKENINNEVLFKKIMILDSIISSMIFLFIILNKYHLNLI